MIFSNRRACVIPSIVPVGQGIRGRAAAVEQVIQGDMRDIILVVVR